MTVEGRIILGGLAAGGVLTPWTITHCQLAVQAGAVHLQCHMQSHRLFPHRGRRDGGAGRSGCKGRRRGDASRRCRERRRGRSWNQRGN